MTLKKEQRVSVVSPLVSVVCPLLPGLLKVNIITSVRQVDRWWAASVKSVADSLAPGGGLGKDEEDD